MCKKLILLLILQIPVSLYCQEIDDRYKQETKQLLKYIIPQFLGTSQLVVNKTAVKAQVKDCEIAYQSDKLSGDELTEVKEKILNPKILYWTEDFFPSAKIVEAEKITEIFKDYENGWKTFGKKYGDNIASFSSPIFLRNYQIAIIKFSIAEGYLSGVGYEAIFVKTENGWEMTACSWEY